MRKRLIDSALIVLFTLIVIMCVLILDSMIRGVAADAETHKIMEEAEARIEAYEAAQAVAVERPKLMVTYVPPMPTVEPVEDWYIECIRLDKQLQQVAFDAACKNGVDYFTVLGLMKVESDFCTDVANPVTGCYGLCQLHPGDFPTGLTPEQNIEFGCGYLGELMERYSGDVEAALTSYNAGYDTGSRWYARAVLDAAEEIMDAAGVVSK